MQFVTLYGAELDRELGTTDRTQRFTTTRRKDAVNAAQLEWLERTECVTKQLSVALVDNQQDYDCQALAADFGWVSKQGISLSFTDAGGNVRWVEGDDLIPTTIENLNQEEPGWRAVAAGTPRKWYRKREGGQLLVGFFPKPAVPAGTTAAALVPYVLVVAPLVADADVPFTVGGVAQTSLAPYHRALVHFAAAEGEKLRKNWAQVQVQLGLFEQYVQRFQGQQQPKGGQRVRLARDYRRAIRQGDRPLRYSRRVWP